MLKTNDKMYWTQSTEDSIIKYNACADDYLRNEIYENELHVPMSKLCQCICNTFKMDYLNETNEDIQAEVLSHLVLQLSKFNVEKGAGKSFGYFGTIAKYYLIHWNKDGYKKKQKEISLDCTNDGDDMPMLDKLESPAKDDKTEFISQLMEWFGDNIDTLFSTWQDKEIAKELIGLYASDIELDYTHVANVSVIRKLIDTTGINASSRLALELRISKVRKKMKEYTDKLKTEYESNGTINLPKCKGMRRVVINSDGIKHTTVDTPVVSKRYLNDDTVALIRNEYASGEYTQETLGRKYGLDQSNVSDLVRGVTYKDSLPDNYQAPAIVNIKDLIGEQHYNSKLRNEQVIEIVSKYKSGMNQADLAREYKMSPQSICDIISGRRWSSVTGISQQTKAKQQ